MNTPYIFIVTGGVGTSGEQVVRTALAQFEDHRADVQIVGQVTQIGQIAQVVDDAAQSGGMIVHTLVDACLREELVTLARERNVVAIDLIGPLLLSLTRLFQQQPLGQPGLYREMREHYFKRIEAIEFAVAHDDGQRPDRLGEAEIVLIGVSRAGKTPLSMYLSTRGWKVANVPLVPEMIPPDTLFEIDNRRVIGLDIEPAQLIAYRERRQRTLGVPGKSSYTDPEAVYAEVDYARIIFRRGRFAVVPVTDKPIEESADEVIARVSRRLRG